MKNLEMIFKSLEPAPIIDAIDYSEYVKINLSISNAELTENRLKTAEEFEDYIEKFLHENKAKVAYGGYLEERKLYKRSSIFNDFSSSERDMHIGLDLWIKAGSVINAPLEGTVHSFKNNIGLGDYGPTILLEHKIENVQFYTLYGHLSLESIEDLKVGRLFKKGDPLATLGNNNVNGNYAPHLHFQIINNIQNYWGDYPGVCSKQDLEFYMENCPNPNLILNI